MLGFRVLLCSPLLSAPATAVGRRMENKTNGHVVQKAQGGGVAGVAFPVDAPADSEFNRA